MKYILYLLLIVSFAKCADTKYSLVKEYMLKNYLVKKLNGKEIFIDKKSLHVKHGYALLKSPPKFKDKTNSYIYFLDTGYAICLKKERNEWIVIYDLSRSDTPDKKQWEDIKATFPKDFPKELLPEFWQKGLK
jgi:hypothetical protein